MFIRSKHISGETYYYLVQSIREGKRPRQKILKFLGTRLEAERYARENGLRLPNPKSSTDGAKSSDIDASIMKLKKELDALQPIPAPVEKKLKENLIILWTYHSTAIEGSTLSLKDTAAVLKEGITSANKPVNDFIAAKAHRDAVNLLYQFLLAKEPIGERNIHALHDKVVQGVMDVFLNKYREEEVMIIGSSHTPPPPNQVPDLMRKWVRDAETNPRKLSLLEHAAVAHIDFEAIHPYLDGNGRTGRLLANWMLMRRGYPPILILKRERKRYFHLLEQAQARGRREGFVWFFKKKVLQALEFYLKYARRSS